jgi:hypoxanthine phosphoribosyltransferase
MKTKKPKHSLDWDDIDFYVNNLYNFILGSKKEYELIAGVTRGGLIPAVMLSHKLDIPIIAIDPNDILDTGIKTLVVDEIYDTGLTIKHLLSRNPAIDVAVIVSKDKHAPVNYVGSYIDIEDWIVFPWETEND